MSEKPTTRSPYAFVRCLRGAEMRTMLIERADWRMLQILHNSGHLREYMQVLVNDMGFDEWIVIDVKVNWEAFGE